MKTSPTALFAFMALLSCAHSFKAEPGKPLQASRAFLDHARLLHPPTASSATPKVPQGPQRALYFGQSAVFVPCHGDRRRGFLELPRLRDGEQNRGPLPDVSPAAVVRDIECAAALLVAQSFDRLDAQALPRRTNHRDHADRHHQQDDERQQHRAVIPQDVTFEGLLQTDRKSVV